MSETFTFEKTNGKATIKFVVKKEFLNKITGPIDDYDLVKLMTEFNLPEYMHNPSGPAIINLVNNYEEYWIEGKNIKDPVTIEKIKHNTAFNEKFNKLIAE